MVDSKPSRFGKYLLLDKIATGGMAELYRAKITGAEGFEKLVAIKKVLPHLNEERSLIESLIDEAKLAALLNQQNIVQIYDFGNIEGTYFIAMEYLFGKDLRSIYAEARKKALPLPLEYALFIVSGVCAGLDYAHQLKDFQGHPLNIVHRDISPQNILVTYQGETKIVDFGIAKAARKSTLTQTGIIKGKAAYMSPEQAEGVKIDHRSDIFSAGVILYELVLGRRMFWGEDSLEVLGKVRRTEFKPPEEVSPDLPEPVCHIIHKALARLPEDRYQSSGQMLNDIEDSLTYLSARPNASTLSKYMKSLFTEEITSETRFLREMSDVSDMEESSLTQSLGLDLTNWRGMMDSLAAKFRRIWEAVTGNTRALFFRKRAAILRHPGLWIGIGAGSTAVGILVITLSLLETPSLKPGQEKLKQPRVGSELSSSKKVVSKAPEGSVLRSDPLLRQAMEALEKGEFASAVRFFEKAVAKEPLVLEEIRYPYAKALSRLGASLVEGKAEKAEALLRKAVKLDPESAEAHFQLGLVYLHADEIDKAISSFQRAGELDPRSADTFFNLGFIYALDRKYALAERMFRKAARLEPSYLDEVYFNLAMVQKKQGKLDVAISNLKRSLRVNPKNKKAKEYLDRFRGE